jgi:hypothetical protein
VSVALPFMVDDATTACSPERARYISPDSGHTRK